MDDVVRHAVQGGVVALVVVSLFALLRAGAGRPATHDPATNELVLQLPSGLARLMGAIAIVGPIAMVVLSFFLPFKNPGEVYVPIAIGAFFLLLSGPLCLWMMRRRTRLGEKGITSEYLFSKPRFLAWADVARVRFVNNQELYLHSGDRHKALLHVWFVGVKEVVPLLRQYLPARVQDLHEEELNKFAEVVGAA